MESPPIPNYIKRDLTLIDKTYFFEWDHLSKGWFVKRKMRLERHLLFIRDPRIGYYKTLDEAILDLKIRKREGIRLNLDRNPEAYLNEIKKRNKEAKEKRRRRNFERMADGMMFGHRMSVRKFYDMGGRSNAT